MAGWAKLSRADAERLRTPPVMKRTWTDAGDISREMLGSALARGGGHVAATLASGLWMRHRSWSHEEAERGAKTHRAPRHAFVMLFRFLELRPHGASTRPGRNQHI